MRLNIGERSGIYIMLVICMLLSATSSLFAQGAVADANERAVLMAIYTNNGGSTWGATQNWNLSKINGYPDSTLTGVQVENDDIVGMSLAGFGLTGTMPSMFGNLSELRSLDISNNNFNNASFPVWLGDLIKLNSLNLRNCHFKGSLPTSIGQLVNLNALYLAANDLSATNSIPNTLSNLDNLTYLDLQLCSLQPGSVDNGLRGLLSLQSLVLSSNPSFLMGDGSFPDKLSNLPTLANLYLQGVGALTFPSSITNLINLTLIDLSSTAAYANTVTLSSAIDQLKLCTSLKTLLIRNSSITTLPSDFDELAVETLNISGNPLSPVGCEVLGGMPELKNLYIEFCSLQNLPATLPDIQTLERLYASNNNLYPVPQLIKDIPDLKELQLMNNGIEELGAWFGSGNMGSIEILKLDNNSLESLPDNICLLSSLKQLSITHNELNGIWPACFSNLTTVQRLHLSYNNISVLPDLSGWGALAIIDVDHNLLKGKVPSFLTDSSSVKSSVNIGYNKYNAVPTGGYNNATVVALNNHFTFEDLLHLKPTSGGYAYAPQDTIVDLVREARTYLTTATLVAHVDTAAALNCKFQWFKYINGVNDSVMNVPSHGAKKFTFNLKASDQGARYYYKITNNILPQLSLNSKLITVVIVCDVTPSAVNFSAKRYLCAMNFVPSVTYPTGCRTKSYSWSFGDNTASIEKKPFHAYNAAGSYNVSMKIIYTCGFCLRDTTITKPVQYNLAEDLLVDSLITVGTEVKAEVLSASAATFSDVWPLQYQSAVVSPNGFVNGSDGVWRNDGTYVYDVPRGHSESINISKDGTFDLEQFNWQQSEIEAIPNWIKANTMTEYSPYSYELENRDVLGVYTSALYDYGGHLPSANGVNMRNREMAFTSFEYLDNRSSGNWIFGNQQLPQYYLYEIYSAVGHIAIVKASLAQLNDVQKVDVTARGFLGMLYPGYYKRTHSILDDEIVCMQEYPQNPEWSMIVLRKEPYVGPWRGWIKVRNTVTPALSPDIDNTFGHTGSSSLKITSPKTFKQNLLQLEGGKSYVISMWVSVKNFHPMTPKLSDQIGVELNLKDKNGNNVLSKIFEPSGRIIEGWQQLKGTFTCPVDLLTLEIQFKPGSTGSAWYDDIRLHPEKGNMKAYVYDLKDYRLRAILDEENFASLFYYDQEGNLYTTKKETEAGIKTISENVTYMVEKTN